MSVKDRVATLTNQGIDALASQLQVQPERGLTDAQAAERLARDGPNQLRAAQAVPGWKKLLVQFHNPVVYLLLTAVAIALAAWTIEDTRTLPIDVVVILAILLLNGVLGYLQEAKADRAVAALRDMTQVSCTVRRNGEQCQIPEADLVVGDILIVNEGDSIGGDARLMQANNLRVSEATLTGESESVLKEAGITPASESLAEQKNMVFKGTGVTEGNGVALVVATGMQTQLGLIAEMLDQTEDEQTPLQNEVSRISKMLAIVVVLIAVTVVGTLLLLDSDHGQSHLTETLLLGVALAVAAVPEGLPAILAIVLALGVQRMAGKQAVIKRLSSVETLGSASVICTDKTGTLTRAEMTVQSVITASGETRFSGIGYEPVGSVEPAASEPEAPDIARDRLSELRIALGGGALANNARLATGADGASTIQGDPTEAALLVAEKKLGDTNHREQRFSRLGEVPFTSNRKMMSVLVQDEHLPDSPVLITKGAPDVLLARCDRVQQGSQIIELSSERRDQVLADITRLTDQAMRTLAIAYRTLPAGFDSGQLGQADTVETGLVYVGVIGLIDPPRLEVAPAIEAAHSAGITVMMMTGDHPNTAGRIASDLTLSATANGVITGRQIDAMDDAALRQALESTRVFARVEPVHKMRIVDALQAAGHIVAMTGDGVNDAPALKAADIGIAMGRTGTEVTKEAADMILVDDRFTTIVDAVRQGRGIFANLRHALRYLLSSNMGEVLTIFLGVIGAGWLGFYGNDGTVLLPLLATQVLWINLITDSGPALVIGLEPVDDAVMKVPPRPPRKPMLDASVWWSVIRIGLIMSLASLLTLDIYLPGGLIEGSSSLAEARTAAFTVLVFGQLFNCLNARSDDASALSHLAGSPWLLGVLAGSVVLQLAVVNLEFLNFAFNTVPLRLDQWLVCIVMASTVLWFEEARKLLKHWRNRPGPKAELISINHPH